MATLMKPRLAAQNPVLKQKKAEQAVNWGFERRNLFGDPSGGQEWYGKPLNGLFSLTIRT